MSTPTRPRCSVPSRPTRSRTPTTSVRSTASDGARLGAGRCCAWHRTRTRSGRPPTTSWRWPTPSARPRGPFPRATAADRWDSPPGTPARSAGAVTCGSFRVRGPTPADSLRSMSATSAASLPAVFKAYDVRGTVPDQIDEELARAVGGAFVEVTGATDGAVVVGHDMRPSSPGLARAFADGASTAGADVTLIGLASTDQLYFASGRLGVPGAMVTASHNPAQYNGIKLCRAHAVPLGMDTGLAAVRDLVAAGSARPATRRGEVVERDLLEEYAGHLLSLVPVTGRRLVAAVD